MNQSASVSPKIRQKQWLFPLVLVTYEVFTYLTNDAYLPAMPQIAKELHLSVDSGRVNSAS